MAQTVTAPSRADQLPGVIVLPAGQRLILFVLLTLNYAAFNVLLSPMGEVANDGVLDMIWGFGRMGFLFGQPALLGMWAVLGPQRFALRVPNALLLAMFFAYSMLLGEMWTNAGYVRADSQWETPLIGVGILTLVQLPFWSLRRWRGWRLQLAGSTYAAGKQDDRRFGILLLLGWVTLCSIVFALWSWIPTDHEGARSSLSLDMFAFILVFAIPCLPMIPLSVGILSDHGRIQALAGLAVMAAVCPPLMIVALSLIESSSREVLGEAFLLELGIVLTGVAALVLTRAVGWRLIRPRARSASPFVSTAIESATLRRFVLLLTGLLAFGGCIALLAVLREPTRREMTIVAEWRRLSLAPIIHGGKLSGIHFFNPQEISDQQIEAVVQHSAAHEGAIRELYLSSVDITEEQLARLLTIDSWSNIQIAQMPLTPAILSHLALLPKLQWLDLTGVPLTDDDLTKLADMPSLNILRLDSTSVTDAGLAALAAISSLQRLTIDGTNVTDAGLIELERLNDLQYLEITGNSGVTPAGIDRLKARFRAANISAQNPFIPPPMSDGEAEADADDLTP